MTATVTTLQEDLKSAIEAEHVANPFPLEVAVRVSESGSASPPAESAPCDIVIGFEASTLLGRTTHTRLEQFLIPVKVRARCDDGDQSRIGTLHAVTEQLRDLLREYNSQATGLTARVEQILQPHPFDYPSSLTPGVFDHRFALDMDVMRTITEAEAVDAADPLPILTETRLAIWDAIDNWSEFGADPSSVWTRKFRDGGDIEELSLHDPAEHELPAIAVTWGPTNPEWWVNVGQNWPQQMFVTFWLPAHQLDLAEERAVQLTRCLYQSSPAGSTVSYVRAATGRPPTKNVITLEAVELGRAQQLKAWKGQLALTLTAVIDPNG
jgi:hypothetical protein